MSEIVWEKEAAQKFNAMIERIPAPMRGIARDAVLKKAADLLVKSGRGEANERDLVDAFFTATPGGFQGPMKADMEALGIDYTKYGYERDEWKKIFGMK